MTKQWPGEMHLAMAQAKGISGNEARRETRIHNSAVDILNRAVDLLAAHQTIHPDELVSAAIPNPVTGGRSMLDAQKFRINWYQIDRKVLNRVARLLSERNWFCEPLHTLDMALYGAGFSFATKEAAAWAKESKYPFHQVHDNLLEEYLVNDCVCAFWSKNPPEGTLPMIEVPDTECVDYETVGGYPQVSITLKRNRKLDQKYKSLIGDRMFDCIVGGKKLVISKRPDDESGYDFEIMKPGKTNACIRPPRATGIIDDLDFLEAVRCGDWNGAWSRREIIRHSKKGSGVSSGPNAGTARNNAKTEELREILKSMKSILGKTDIATNFDHDLEWLLFDKNFFGSEITDPVMRRLVYYGGLPALLLLKTDSQFDGLASHAFAMYRARVESFRAKFGGFLYSIFNSESFRSRFSSAPEMNFQWSVKPLYSLDSFIKLTSHLHTFALDSTPAIRAMFGIDDESAAEMMRRTHNDPLGYTPVFEPRQGISSAFTAPDSKNASPPSSPGNPGRPASEDG